MRNISMWLLLTRLLLGSGLQARQCALMGIELATLSFLGPHSIHTSQGREGNFFR